MTRAKVEATVGEPQYAGPGQLPFFEYAPPGAPEAFGPEGLFEQWTWESCPPSAKDAKRDDLRYYIFFGSAAGEPSETWQVVSKDVIPCGILF